MLKEEPIVKSVGTPTAIVKSVATPHQEPIVKSVATPTA